MAVYVDSAIDYGKRIGKAGPWWCHMTADTPDELHAFAERLGLRREWCSDHTHPNSSQLHYDLACNPWNKRNLRVRALAMRPVGAVDISGHEHEVYPRLRAGSKGVPA